MLPGYLRRGLICLALLFASCGDDAGVNTRDTIPPAAIQDLQAGCQVGGEIVLFWTAPGDDSLTGTAAQYAIRLADQPITLETWDSASLLTGGPKPKPSGRINAFTITGLMPDRLFFMAVRTADEVGNWSGLSNVAAAYSTPDFDPMPPAVITDLSVIDSTESSISLTWTAVGDDSIYGRASRYEVKYDTAAIDSANWSTAITVSGVPLPSLPGVADNVTVGGLQDSTVYYFGIKALDEVGNSGQLSNVVQTITPVDMMPPDAVTDLRLTDSTRTTVTFTWTAPGDDGSEGTAHLYSLRYSLSPIDDTNWATATELSGVPAPQPPGSEETFTVANLSISTTYYFAIRVADDSMNWSPISEAVPVYLPNPVVWEKNIGGTGTDIANAVAIAADGGIVIAGITNSTGAGDYDGYVLKMDTDGDVVWEKTFGGSAEDVINDIVTTADGGFAAIGFTKSAGVGGNDGWLVKLSSSGTKVWEKTFGTDGHDYFRDVLRTDDGGFFMAGYSNGRAFVVKTDAAGVKQWDSTYYRLSNCGAYTQYATADGAVESAGKSIIVAWSASYDRNYPPNDCAPQTECYFTKLDPQHGEVYTRLAHAAGFSSYVWWATGTMVSTGSGSFAIVRLSSDVGRRFFESWDSEGNVLWQQNAGHWLADPVSVVRLANGSFVPVGYTRGSTRQAWFGLVNSSGELVDQFFVGGDSDDRFHAVVQTSDGSIIAVGYTDSFSESRDIYIVKLRL